VTVFAVVQVLYLFVPAYVANMSPVLVQGHFAWLARPIDGGREWRGRRVLGDHKTWRGLVAGTLTGGVVYEIQRLVHGAGLGRDLALLDYDAWPVLGGVLMGFGALLGDAVKSFFKRQVGIAPGRSWLGFDQLDFYLGAWLVLAPLYSAPLAPFVASLPLVFVGDVVTNAAAHVLGWKDSWI
jgi:CDP-2,3-bis-(O-geranylgeranyl)-sn-glycerol synthase